MFGRWSSKTLWIFCTAVFAVGFIAAAYLNFVQYQNYQSNTTLLNGTITDLKYQLAQDSASPSPKASPSPTATPGSSPTVTPSITPTTTPTVSPTVAPAAPTATTNQLANLHATADVNSKVIQQLASGTVVTITGAVSGQYQPVSVGGNSGYVRKDYLTY